MRRRSPAIAVIAGLLLAASAAFAGVDINEVENPGFEEGSLHWEASETVIFGPNWEHSMIAYDPTGQGESGYLRQVIDNARSPYWDPLLNHKIGELQFWAYTTGTGYIKVGFDWWDSIDIPKPMPGTPADHFVILPDEFVSPNQWTLFTVPFDWAGQPGNNQPRWISLEFYFYGCTGTGNEAGVDDISFTSRCIPEPSSMLAVFGGIAGLAGTLHWRRRRV